MIPNYLGQVSQSNEIPYQRAALIKDNIVVNVVALAVSQAGKYQWTPPEGHQVALTEEAGPGWTWDGQTFQEPVIVVKEPVASTGDLKVI
ncbi:hypothetical protein UFOVP1518_13 [uncultured Caudovirales phage]|uniref:Uncharacterized protein n=1 Tax=uncultured Caudovirales phage TaxID=2100421 RepID=A0A6J5RAI2_9CAUD|nr:hypothetical protein UFOVP475_26 [uncultured Caudovirales phage]CAB4169580.1 hypothetical protein UFOVP897_56 [uncultured Caudovirales phage]CAB4175813.1 hypothetical protein UFOVP984_26 [uncultured Caudovirales phage]CAB4181591.1 hypothetical protein UFOVP1072_47 [uncultured Caudovirales phage]CAB4191377.1 hypothetical protein UFOVP1211_25 [uncultured Caudovirales phage]